MMSFETTVTDEYDYMGTINTFGMFEREIIALVTIQIASLQSKDY